MTISDERDLLYRVTDANQNTTTYTYDEFDRLRTTVYPDSSTEAYTYDPASNLTELRSPKSEVRRYAYDSLNRLTFKEYVSCTNCGGNVDYTYDPGSRLTHISNSNASISYQYDSLNRVKGATTTLNASPFTLHYEYDASGNRTQLTYPHGRVITYTYDSLNRLKEINPQSEIGNPQYLFSYDSLSRRTQLTRPNGISTSYTYDTLNRLTQMQHGSIATISYPLYDKVGNRRQMVDVRGQTNYSYDSLYQLTSASGATTASYTYDPVGNRTSSEGPGIPSSYTPNTLNQYATVDETSYTYDLNGNLTSDGDQVYEYDFENRLIRVTPAPPNTSLRGSPAGATEAIYEYDPFGRRLSSSLRGAGGDEAISYLYDGDQIIETYPCDLTADACSLSQSFLSGPGIDEPLEITSHPSQVTSYYHQDGLGSITHLTNSSGSSIESYTYDAYGIRSTTSSIGNPFLFTGREYDHETGLYYLRRRYYDPRIGRFLSRDPVYGGNLYAYVRNNAINIPDPWGLRPGDKYRSQDEAASNALNDVLPGSVREDREHGGWVYRNTDGTYSYTPTNKGMAHQTNLGRKPPSATASYHTHGAESGPLYDDENFSPQDIRGDRGVGVDGYLGTPSGKYLKYDNSRNQVDPIDRSADTGIRKEGFSSQSCKRGKESQI
ncbi:MAG: hypothetical protein A3G87_01380 [Omnitrophica bacterium RIFCSPLOWO2_12_FULL_50_11]|nr:MAG: hypothetical protein A3G87_01380 [Omnitrophica bacterium RIFCSPLOWO2_12_FULL_50_11]